MQVLGITNCWSRTVEPIPFELFTNTTKTGLRVGVTHGKLFIANEVGSRIVH